MSSTASLCGICRGINIESLATPGGHRHLTVGAVLQQSAKQCWLCSRLVSRIPKGKTGPPEGSLVLLTLKQCVANCSGISFGAYAEITFENFDPPDLPEGLYEAWFPANTFHLNTGEGIRAISHYVCDN
jgi:hypothetical protein